jgi:hypothetical protein
MIDKEDHIPSLMERLEKSDKLDNTKLSKLTEKALARTKIKKKIMRRTKPK